MGAADRASHFSNLDVQLASNKVASSSIAQAVRSGTGTVFRAPAVIWEFFSRPCLPAVLASTEERLPARLRCLSRMIRAVSFSPMEGAYWHLPEVPTYRPTR